MAENTDGVASFKKCKENTGSFLHGDNICQLQFTERLVGPSSKIIFFIIFC